MTPSEKQFKLSEIDRQVQMLLDERRAVDATPVTTPHKVWEPEFKGDYVLSITLADTTRDNSPEDLALISAGMAHSSGGSAKRHSEFLVMLHDLHKFAVEHNEGWKPDWKDWRMSKWIIGLKGGVEVYAESWQTHLVSPLPHFKSESIAQKAIDTFGDRLKILFEYYNS